MLEYDTVPACEKELEAHRDYFDVQFVASGEELLQFADCEASKPSGLRRGGRLPPAQDPEPVTSIVLRAGELAIFAPEDAHKPGCALGEPCHVRKIVVKVRA
ncbi:MAG: YhcH/YjgK/YiaL family protein [Collinsella sp.]